MLKKTPENVTIFVTLREGEGVGSVLSINISQNSLDMSPKCYTDKVVT
jgi:hypothetical protein